MTTPNKDALRLWVKELREGGHGQTYGRLHTDAKLSMLDGRPVGYCCLGVACLVAEREGVQIVSTPEWRQKGLLPPEVWKWLGVNNPNPILGESLMGNSAIDLNDGQRQPFTYIADAIEKKFELKEGSTVD